MCNQCISPCNNCNPCNSLLQQPCNSCTSPEVNPCSYDCSPPLWVTWPRIEIRRCNLPSLYGCGQCQCSCQNQHHHRVYEDSSESQGCGCEIPCQLNPCCDPTLGLCAGGCKKD